MSLRRNQESESEFEPAVELDDAPHRLDLERVVLRSRAENIRTTSPGKATGTRSSLAQSSHARRVTDDGCTPTRALRLEGMSVATEHEASERLQRWLPDDAVIDIVARRERRASNPWTAEIPTFRIRQPGDSRDDAVARAREQLVSYFSEALGQGKSYEEAAAARKRLIQGFGLLFLLLLAIKVARDKDASWWRVPGDMLVAEDWEAARETVEILQDEETMAALHESDEDLDAGRVRPYEEVRRDLGLG